MSPVAHFPPYTNFRLLHSHRSEQKIFTLPKKSVKSEANSHSVPPSDAIHAMNVAQIM